MLQHGLNRFSGIRIQALAWAPFVTGIGQIPDKFFGTETILQFYETLSPNVMS